MTHALFCLLLTTFIGEPILGLNAGQTLAATNIAAYTTSAAVNLAAATQSDKSLAHLHLDTTVNRTGAAWLLAFDTTSVRVEGGCAPYTYQWAAGPNVVPYSDLSGPQATFIVALGTDSYATVTVTDCNGVTATASVRLYYPQPGR